MIIGFGCINDIVAHQLRVRLAKKYGLFGNVPMFGGFKLHELYPPATSIMLMIPLQYLLPLYFFLWSCVFAPDFSLAGLYFCSFLHLWITLKVGRISESFGLLFVAASHLMRIYVVPFSMEFLSGFFLGIAGLFHPTAFLCGVALWGIRILRNIVEMRLLSYPFTPELVRYYVTCLIPLLSISAAAVMASWYVPFIRKRKQLPFLGEKRGDKLFGIYYTSYLSMINLAVFILLPKYALLWFCVTAVGYSLPLLKRVKFVQRLRERVANAPLNPPVEKWRIWTLDDVPKLYPKLDSITAPVILLKSNRGISMQWELWACTLYLLEKRGIVVYNGMIETEVLKENLEAPLPDLPSYVLEELK